MIILATMNQSPVGLPPSPSLQASTVGPTFTLDSSLTSSISSCKVGDVAPQHPADPDYFQEFEAPSQPPELPVWEMGLKITFYVLAFLVTVAGNSLVILITCRNRKMRSTTNVLLLNLAVADLMVAAVRMWVHLGNAITAEWPFGNFVCKVNTFCRVVAVTSSVLTLTVISVERFKAIVFPFRDRWSTCTTSVIITVIWVMAVVVALPHLLVRHIYQQRWKDRHEVWCAEDWPQVYKDVTCNTWEPGKIVYYSIEGIVMYVVPVMMMFVAYSIITYRLLTRSFPGTLITSTVSAQERAKRMVIKMLVAVFVYFVLCWSPQQCILLYGVFRPFLGLSVNEASGYHQMKYTALYVAYLNSALNPILYCGFNDNFRQACREVLRRVLATRANRIHPVGDMQTPDKQNGYRPNNKKNKNNINSRPASPDPSTSSGSTQNGLCQHVPEARQSSAPTRYQVTEIDDTIEDILDDTQLPSPNVNTCRRRSFQPEECFPTRVAWQAIP